VEERLPHTVPADATLEIAGDTSVLGAATRRGVVGVPTTINTSEIGRTELERQSPDFLRRYTKCATSKARRRCRWDDMPSRILVVEDAPDIRMMISAALAQEPYEIAEADTGRSALNAARAVPPDIVLLDLGLPDMDGLDVCRELKAVTNAYVIVLSGRDADPNFLIGPDVGADDHIMKPFSPRKLVAQMRAAVRRLSAPAQSGTHVHQFGGVNIDLHRRDVTFSGSTLRLRPDELDVLVALLRGPEGGMTRDQLLEAVWGAGRGAEAALVDECVASLDTRIRSHVGTRFVEATNDGYRITRPLRVTS
jgi:DNA-binding response OmpR family regulator